MKWNKSKIWIVILSVLLAIVSAALVVTLIQLSKTFAQGTSIAPNNQIGQHGDGTLSSVRSEAVSEVAQLDAESELPPVFYASSSSLDSEKVKLTDKGAESATPIKINNMFPGDSFSKNYVVSIKDDSVEALLLSFACTDQTANPTDAQQNRDRSLMQIVVSANGTEVYHGPLDSAFETEPYLLHGEKEVTYVITISLDVSAGNEYSRLKLEMTMNWTPEYTPIYTVTYSDGLDGSAFPAQNYSVKSGNAAPAFVGTPKRNGYKFVGWDPENSGIVASNVTYTAKWEKLFSVTYTDGSADQSYFKTQCFAGLEKGSATPAFFGAPYRPGYVFAGWYPARTNTVEKDVVYTAQWKSVTPPEPTEYTVIYTDGVPGEVIFADKIIKGILSGDDTPSFGEDPVREGYTFEGWSPAVAEFVTGNVTYTAQWKAKIPEPVKYTVIYTDGVDGEEIFGDLIFENVLDGTPTPLFSGDLKRAGYVFAGWYPEVTETVSANVTYVAQWEEAEVPALIIDAEHREVSADLMIRNPRGGDTETYRYQLIIRRDGHLTLFFDADVAENAEQLAEHLNISVLCEETGEILYHGYLADMPEYLETALTSYEGEVLHYAVCASLDELYWDQYTEDTVLVHVKWWVEEPSADRCCRCCIVCFLVRWLGGPYCIFPWCLIIYLLIIWHIVMYLIGKRRNRKIIKELTEQGALDDVIKENSYRRYQYIWLGIKVTLSLFKRKKKALKSEEKKGDDRDV